MTKLFLSAVVGAISFMLIENFIVGRHIDKDVKELKLQNDSLVQANIQLDSLEQEYLGKMNEANFELAKLEHEDMVLQNKVGQMNENIKVIKTKYEKAKHFSDSYGSDDIKRYFSNLR